MLMIKYFWKCLSNDFCDIYEYLFKQGVQYLSRLSTLNSSNTESIESTMKDNVVL